MEHQLNDIQPPCELAERYLGNNEIEPTSDLLPAASARWYIPRRHIDALLAEKAAGIDLETLFLCPCGRCTRDGGPIHDRATHFNKLREQELRNDYATIYALLVHVHRPGLIRVFQRHELKLLETRYLQEEDFGRLSKEKIVDLEALKRKILRDQYSFHVRTLKPYSDVKVIPAKELLPIEENAVAKGEGSFAEVRCFVFQNEEYRSKEFGQITKFARKIFKNGQARSSAKEWYNLQSLSKATNHPHLMSALGAYWHGDAFFILMEEADLSLHDYLSRGLGAKIDSHDLWKQVRGLAEGLDTLHQLYQATKIAYHQDLKPANILIVRGTLKIADFGLLEFKPVLPDDIGSTGVISSHNTGYYAPPRRGRYTREDDIWSFACIVSELATADIQGRDEIAKYKEARISNGIAGRDTPAFFIGKNVKTQVLEKHRELQRTVHSQESADQAGVASPFQKKFYNSAFFVLLNSMLRHGDSTGNLLAVPGQVVIPDAGKVAETLGFLRKEAISTPSLDDQNQVPGPSTTNALRNIEGLAVSLHNILTTFQTSLNQKEERKFRNASLSNLERFIYDLQTKQCSERRQQGLKRLGPFLDAFKQLRQLLEKFCESDTFMTFIWGPVRYALEITKDDPEAFREVLDVYSKVGLNQPIYTQYEELFHTQLDVAELISAGYFDVLQIHKLVLQVFTQRCWRDIYLTTWPRHKTQISAHVSCMAARLELIVHGGSMPQSNTVTNLSTRDYENNNPEMDDENLKRRQTVYTWLKPIEMESEHYHFQQIRTRCPPGSTPGRWLLDHTTFKEWFDPDYTALPTLLWLHGNPGAGKSVLASMVVDEAQKLTPKPTVLFFYFKQCDVDRDNFASMARTLLAQLLQDDTGILDYMYNKSCKSVEPFLSSRSFIEELLIFALGNCKSAYIILDGLDECCSRDEKKTIVKFFRALIENHDDDADRLRCLFVSRKDSARKDFNDLAQISVELENNEDDIDAFCRFRSRELGDELGIPEPRLKEIVDAVSACADGMFLVAELVWLNLCGQTSLAGLEDELASLPTGLDKVDEAYGKIMKKILDKPARARDEAMVLLGWLVCAKRPLKSHEIQTMKSINLERREIEFDRRRFRVNPKDLCESLVDVRADGSIELVHLTAKVYLLSREDFDGAVEELKLATFCVDYLNLPIFNEPFSTHAVLEGSYGFMEYAVLNWVRHLEAGISFRSDPDDLSQGFLESFESLLETHRRQPTIEPKISKRTQDRLEIFRASSKHKEIQQAVASTQESIKRFGDMRPGECALDLIEVVATIRKQIELVVIESTTGSVDQAARSLDADLELKYGTNLFKCPRFSCKYFTHGFASKNEREGHIQRHERPFRCTDMHCTGFIGFAKEEQLARHLKETHADPASEDTFPTEEEIAESQIEYVPDADVEVEDTQTPVVEDVNQEVAAEVAPEPESASVKAAQPAQSSRPAKRTKTQTEFECPYCEKTFTKRYNRDSHLKTHGVGGSLACPRCGTLCARQSDLTRHMKKHTEVKPFTCGGSLMSGERWGCGQSFLRADILSNHHKSKKGKKCIAVLEEEEQMESATDGLSNA